MLRVCTVGGTPQATAVGKYPPAGVAASVTGMSVAVGVWLGMSVACGGEVGCGSDGLLVAAGGDVGGGDVGAGVGVRVTLVKLGSPKTGGMLFCWLKRTDNASPAKSEKSKIRRIILISQGNLFVKEHKRFTDN